MKRKLNRELRTKAKEALGSLRHNQWLLKRVMNFGQEMMDEVNNYTAYLVGLEHDAAEKRIEHYRKKATRLDLQLHLEFRESQKWRDKYGVCLKKRRR